MLTQQQLMLSFGALVVVVVLGIVFYNYGGSRQKKTCARPVAKKPVPLRSLPPLMATKAPPVIEQQREAPPKVDLPKEALIKESPPPAPPAPENSLPPLTAVDQAPSSQTVNEHRAELLRGSARARARVSAPTTSALIMTSAMSSRDQQGSRQNIGETAVMDRLHPNPSSESVPW